MIIFIPHLRKMTSFETFEKEFWSSCNRLENLSLFIFFCDLSQVMWVRIRSVAEKEPLPPRIAFHFLLSPTPTKV